MHSLGPHCPHAVNDSECTRIVYVVDHATILILLSQISFTVLQ